MKKHYLAQILLAIISSIFVLWIISTDVFKSFELKFIDYRFKWRVPHKANPEIIITAIDDNSINSIGKWPWPRKIHAALLKTLSQYPPKVIAFDILFTEPEKDSEEGDTALSYYSELLGNVVYAGYLNLEKNKEVLPIRKLLDVSSVGYINAKPDNDGIIRKIPIVIKHGNAFLPSFSLKILCEYLDADVKDIKINLGKYISIPKIGNIPIDEGGNMWVNYAGDQHVFKQFAFQQILSWPQDEKKMQIFDKSILLVGITATGIVDHGNLPIGTNIPLIAVHANALNTILNKDFLHKTPMWVNILIILFALLISILINLFLKSIKAGFLSLISILLYLAISLFLFQKNIIVDVLGPLFGIIAPFVLITIYKYGWEERQKKWIKKVFVHYLSSDVINMLLKNPDKLKLGGELKKATVMYLDLRNFSTYCEAHSPHEVVSSLNECFDWMTDIIIKNGGMLDKYIGDAIMAIFGAPLDKTQERQAEEAVTTAIEIIKKWRNVPLNMRCSQDVTIGINTGPMLIGNIGSNHIFNYTAIGDEVNIASRVQGLTGKYGVNIIITDSVKNLLNDKFKTEPLGEVILKGRKTPVLIYSVSY